MKYGDKELQFIADRIEKQMYELSEWEQGFFTSVAPRIKAGIPLSSKQAKCLSKIWDKLGEVR